MSEGDLRADPATAALARLRADLGAQPTAEAWPRGVVGASSAGGTACYGYPEIAGYWLHWACRRDDVGDSTGDAVVDWLQQTHKHYRGWPTRIGEEARVYAEGTYLFDHVMLWFGLRQWGAVRRSATASALADCAWEQAQQFVHAGGLVAARGAKNTRWSGQIGPFLLKACARAQRGDGGLGVASRQALPTLLAAALARPHAQAHPQLYAIEGLIELGERGAAAQALRALIATHGGIGEVRESVGAGARRSDVLAQLLRAALVLDLVDRADPAWKALAGELAARVDARGRVPFAAPGDDCPTWAALFAEQALSVWRGQNLSDRGLV